MSRFTCDPEAPCAEHDCHEHDDARHHYELPRTDLDSPGYRAEHRVCICGAVDVNDLPWCFCGHGRDSHGVDVAILGPTRLGCAGCACGDPDDPDQADPMHAFEVVVDGRGRYMPVPA